MLPSTSYRNHGLDLLRIICMFMVTILHILGQGGILEAAKSSISHFSSAWFLETVAFCAVNCYAALSGYVMVYKDAPLRSLFKLYAQVLFYTLPTTTFFLVFFPGSVGKHTLLEAVFPFAYNTYWYFTAYFCLYLMIPFLNQALRAMNTSQLDSLVVTLFILFSLLPTVFQFEFTFTSKGYCVLWLSVMYVFGAYLRIRNTHFFNDPSRYLGVYIFLSLFSWIWKILIGSLTERLFGTPMLDKIFIAYTSPTMIFCAVSLLLFFARLSCSCRVVAWINFFAPAAFGVYLLHEEPLIVTNLLTDAFVSFTTHSVPTMVLLVLLTAFFIWLIGSFLDRIRILLFRYIPISPLCIRMENLAFSIVHWASNRIATHSSE